MLQIENLSYQINKVSILKGLNLAIENQQYYALAGENGAGKSTLIKIILDLIRNIQQGKISVAGHDNKSIAARKKIAYLPEKFDLKKDVSGWQYLNFIFGVYSKPVDKNKVAQLCEQLSLETAKLSENTRGYSKGMKQKLGLISCFMLDNPLIILDEPLSGLDPKARCYFKQLLQQERNNNRTIFYSTHMLADAEEITDSFGILHQGKIVFNGSPASCLQQYSATTLEQAYMNCVTGFTEKAG